MSWQTKALQEWNEQELQDWFQCNDCVELGKLFDMTGSNFAAQVSLEEFFQMAELLGIHYEVSIKRYDQLMSHKSAQYQDKRVPSHSSPILSQQEQFELDRYAALQFQDKEEKRNREDYECPVCYDDLRQDQKFEFSCSHSICGNCARTMIETALKEAKTPICSECKAEVSGADISLLSDLFAAPTLHRGYEDMMLRIGVTNMDSSIPCPTRGCSNWSFADKNSFDRHGLCPLCNTPLCSACGKLYHHSGSCENIDLLDRQWVQWQTNERKVQQTKLNEQSEKQRQRQAEVQARIAELKADEAWKQQNVRHCPHCGKGVNKLAGCNSMKCGTDYHGGNNQNGCGNSFDWSSAAPYKPKVDESKFEKITYTATNQTEHGIECEKCNNPIIGFRFQCIHCPFFNLCSNCEANESAEHDITHIFKIHQTKEQ